MVTLNVFYDGSHHLAFGYNALMLVSYVDGVYVFAGFGDAATATLDTNATPATFSWHVDFGGGCPPEHPYNSLTVPRIREPRRWIRAARGNQIVSSKPKTKPNDENGQK